MTSPVTPPAPIAVPEFPQLGDPAFNAKAYANGSAMPAVVANISDIADSAFTNATSANESALAAVAQVVSASAAASIALGASNFKGEWSTLTGAISKPACVKHSGRFWMLLNNLANVATSEPGVSADWTSLDAGDRPSQTINTDTTAIAGVCYLFSAGAKLTLPTAWAKGDYIGWRTLANVQGASVDFGSTKLWGAALDGGILSLDLAFSPMDLTYENPTWGLK